MAELAPVWFIRTALLRLAMPESMPLPKRAVVTVLSLYGSTNSPWNVIPLPAVTF